MEHVHVFPTMELKNVSIYTEHGLYYLDLTYQYEQDGSLYEVHIPKVRLAVERLIDIRIDSGWYDVATVPVEVAYAFFNDRTLSMQINPIKNRYFEVHTIKKKMTLEEIEKELGYKVEIIEKKE